MTDAVLTDVFGKEQIFSTDAAEGSDPNGMVLGLYEKNEATGKFEKAKEFVFPENIARNAGDWFVHEGKVYRPAQECNKSYGHGISLQEVVKQGEEYKFQEVRRMLSPHPTCKKGFHTMNIHDGMIVVDCKGYKHGRIAKWVDDFRHIFPDLS